MAIPGRGSRLIVVDGVRYRWTVTGKRDHLRGVVVELADSPASRMTAGAEGFEAVIVPAMVSLGIRRALDDGWNPRAGGRPFRLATPLDRLPSAT